MLKIGLNFKLLILFLIDLLAYPPFHFWNLPLILKYSLLEHVSAKLIDCVSEMYIEQSLGKHAVTWMVLVPSFKGQKFDNLPVSYHLPSNLFLVLGKS